MTDKPSLEQREQEIRDANKPPCPNCRKPGSHFAPPSLGEAGFYTCEKAMTPEEIGDAMRKAIDDHNAGCKPEERITVTFVGPQGMKLEAGGRNYGIAFTGDAETPAKGYDLDAYERAYGLRSMYRRRFPEPFSTWSKSWAEIAEDYSKQELDAVERLQKNVTGGDYYKPSGISDELVRQARGFALEGEVTYAGLRPRAHGEIILMKSASCGKTASLGTGRLYFDAWDTLDGSPNPYPRPMEEISLKPYRGFVENIKDHGTVNVEPGPRENRQQRRARQRKDAKREAKRWR